MHELPVCVRGRVIVCCPGGAVSGGPELLHQLVHELRSLGHDAYISYYPFDVNFEKPAGYRSYDAPSISMRDDPSDMIIFPEVATVLASRILKARVAIWWLSVGFYFCASGESRFWDMVSKYKSLFGNRVPIRKLRSYLHFCQSEYARDFLRKESIESVMLTDYLSAEHFGERPNRPRRDIIAYNPNKGVERTQYLMRKCGDLSFVPIENMSKQEVAALLSDAKIYIDFGHHPGKDRIPREAVMAGCCVVTGVRGSAAFEKDLPVPSRFKIDESSGSFVKEFRAVVEEIVASFERCSSEFDEYRRIVRDEPRKFSQQVLEIFGRRNDMAGEAAYDSVASNV